MKHLSAHSFVTILHGLLLLPFIALAALLLTFMQNSLRSCYTVADSFICQDIAPQEAATHYLPAIIILGLLFSAVLWWANHHLNQAHPPHETLLHRHFVQSGAYYAFLIASLFLVSSGLSSTVDQYLWLVVVISTAVIFFNLLYLMVAWERKPIAWLVPKAKQKS